MEIVNIAKAASPRWTLPLILHNVFALGANLLQIYGVIYLGWDTFQILMLYWMETLIIATWALLRLAVMPANFLGEMTVNGRVVAATNTLLLQMFVPFVAISMVGHLLILWAMFAGPNAESVHGPVSFVSRFVISSHAWVPLSLTFWAGVVTFYECPKRADFLHKVRALFVKDAVPTSTFLDGVTPAIGSTLIRIVTMQAAIIIGGMAARSYGNNAPWLILIGLKILADYQRPDAATAQNKTTT